MEEKLLDVIKSKLAMNQPVCQVMVAQVEGTAPRSAGAMMVVDHQGLLAGTIGGGRIEYLAIEKAKELMVEKKSTLENYEIMGENDQVSGRVSVFFKSFSPAEKLYIFGGGHVGYQLYLLASKLRFEVTVFDDREGFLDPQRFPEAILKPHDLIESLKQANFDQQTYVVVASRSHESDENLLFHLLGKELAYLGMLGSRKKTDTIKKNLLARGVDKACFDGLYAPIGLSLGGQHPEEVALSILAQLVQVRNA